MDVFINYVNNLSDRDKISLYSYTFGTLGATFAFYLNLNIRNNQYPEEYRLIAKNIVDIFKNGPRIEKQVHRLKRH